MTNLNQGKKGKKRGQAPFLKKVPVPFLFI